VFTANWRLYIQMKKMEEQRKIRTTISAHILHKQYYGVYKAGYTNGFSRTATSSDWNIISRKWKQHLNYSVLFLLLGQKLRARFIQLDLDFKADIPLVYNIKISEFIYDKRLVKYFTYENKFTQDIKVNANEPNKEHVNWLTSFLLTKLRMS
jgi:hypothetical protein